MTHEHELLVERVGAVGVLTLNRPDRMNAWTMALQDRFYDALEELGGDESIRAVVLTGAGRAFCAGADMDIPAAAAVSGEAPTAERSSGFPFWFLTTFPKPVVAAINGACAGVGLVLAMYSDYRVAASKAAFATGFVRRGLVAEMGISWSLQRAGGTAVALDLLLSGRRFTAAEALGWGLLNEVTEAEDAVERAVEYAQNLAKYSSPAAMAEIKCQVWADAHRALEDADLQTAELIRASLRRPDVPEGVASFVEKRDPQFAPLSSEEGLAPFRRFRPLNGRPDAEPTSNNQEG